jgi:hypothetical protein
MAEVHSDEFIYRLLFSHRMIDGEGKLSAEAFPTDELVEEKEKSVSVDRETLIEKEWLKWKLVTYEKPEAGRAKWGHCRSQVVMIAGIISQDGKQVFSVLEDQITGNFPPNPWDNAHAKIVRASSSFSKSFVRGYRDKLIEAFEPTVVRLF